MIARTGRLRSLTIQPQGADSRARIELVCERLPPPPEGNWAPETNGRRKVAHLSMLRGADAEVAAGGQVQGLVLKSADGTPFDPAAALRREPDAPPAALVFVVFRTAEPAAEAHAKLAAFTAESLAADRAAPDETGLPAMRLVVRSVAATDAPPEEAEARRVSAGWERAARPPCSGTTPPRRSSAVSGSMRR